jgi:hypothetical protein
MEKLANYPEAGDGVMIVERNRRFGYSPDGQVVSRTGAVARNGSALDLNDATRYEWARFAQDEEGTNVKTTLGEGACAAQVSDRGK